MIQWSVTAHINHSRGKHNYFTIHTERLASQRTVRPVEHVNKREEERTL